MLLEVFCNLCAVGQGLVLLPFACLLNCMIYSLWPLAWLVDWLGIVQECRDGEVVGKAKGAFDDLGAVPRPRLLAVFRPLALETSSVRNIEEAVQTPAPSDSPSKASAAPLSTKDNSANSPTCASSSEPGSGQVSGVASGATAANEAPASCSGAVVPCSPSHEEQIRPVSTDSTDSRPSGGPCYNYETDTDDDEEDYRTITEIVRTTPAEKLLGSWRHDGMPALGTGGFGAVYRGHLPLSAGREIEAVAKIYSAAGDQGAVHMKRESRAMRMLQESGAEGRGCVLQMYAAGMHPSENRPMLLVELASSCLYDSLRAAERCRQNAGMTSADAPLMGEAEMVGVLLAVAGALTEMHEIGIVHQDIKPENVLYRANGDPCVADMGLAVVLGPGRRSYRSGCGGTCWFAAPELGLHLPALTDWVMLRRSLEEQEQLAAAAAAGAQQLDEQVAMTEEESDETETETETEEESSGGMDLGSSLEGSGASEFESGSGSDSGSESGSKSSEGRQSQQQQQHQPEQKRKRAPALTPAVDVWSLGMLALSMAVTGNGVQAWAYAVMRRKELPGYVPTWVAALIRDCTEWQPRARPSAAQVLERLQAVKAGIAVRRV